METVTLLTEIERYVRQLFSKYQRPYLIYHSLQHTTRVVTHTKEIAEYYKYNDLSLFIVLTAAWFHDTGHLQVNMDTHEQKSISIMVEFLSSKGIDATIMGK